MFAIFIIFAWSLTLVASVSLIVFATSAIMLLLTSANPPAIITKILNIFTEPLFGSIFGSNGKADISNIGKPEFNEKPILIWIVVSMAIAIVLIVLSIIELVRLRKHQKLSKPFVKITLLASAVVILLTGQLVFFIASMLIFAAVVLLEVVLFDSVALNNYAEERNLISIYREERKFEKEVTKEGKLIGNVELRNQKKVSQKENEQNKRNDNSALPILNETQLDNFFKETKNKKYYLKWKEYKTKLEIKRIEIEENFYSFEEDKKSEIVGKFNFNVIRLNKLGKKIKIPDEYQVMHLDLNKLVDDNYPQTSVIFKDNINEKIEASLNEIEFDEDFIEGQKANAINMSVEQLEEIDLPSNVTSDLIYQDFNLQQPKSNEGIIVEDIESSNNNQIIISDIKEFSDTTKDSSSSSEIISDKIETKKEEDLDMIDLPKLEFSEFNQNFDGPSAKAINMSMDEIIETNLPVKSKEDNNSPNFEFNDLELNKDENLEGNVLKSDILEQSSISEKLARAVNMDINQLFESSNTNIDSIYSDFNFKQSDLSQKIVKSDSNNIENSPKSYITLPPKMSLEVDNQVEDAEETFIFENIEEKESNKLAEENILKTNINQSDFEESVYANQNTFNEDLITKNEDTNELTPDNYIQENLFSKNQLITKEVNKSHELNSDDETNRFNISMNQQDEKHLSDNHDNNYEINKIREQLALEQQNLAASYSSKILEFEKKKISSIEERIFKLENLLERLETKIIKENRVSYDFRSVSNQLESISKVVSELSNSNPRNIINSLTTRYEYNKSNG
ncbi:hypothetical protein [Spiroplasma endosymbiont of Cantharis lateralis]|uniref:hypothetical protein n=1 Tax=Spiroplasma endosymbiont of Cantharis lateralis TaxID=3066277 RepID=UPI00313D0717